MKKRRKEINDSDNTELHRKGIRLQKENTILHKLVFSVYKFYYTAIRLLKLKTLLESTSSYSFI